MCEIQPTYEKVQQPKKSRVSRSIFSALLVFIASTVFSFYGFKLRSHFHCGDECDMTHSLGHFVDLDLSHKSSNYKLFKFTDRRDQRYSHLRENHAKSYDHDEGDTTERWCQTSHFSASVGHSVLYVHGHLGSYTQSRSLGAHGVQFSGGSYSMDDTNMITQSLTNGTFHAHADTIDNFLYDVYSVDFGEEGSAFHASKLFAQANFIARSVEFIAEGCGKEIEDITIVAHSIGGLASRMAVVLLNKKLKDRGDTKTKLAQNVITLASPHVSMPLNFETSIKKFYDVLKREESAFRDSDSSHTTNVISISGGLRDELIPPGSCGTGDMNSGDENVGIALSILASDVMSPKSVGRNGALMYGMDHRAIVWCHNIVSVVRDLIYVMKVSSNSTTSETREQVHKYVSQKMAHKSVVCHNDELNGGGCKSTHAYEHRIRLQEQTLQDEYGFWGSQAMFITMLYNVQLLIFLYVLNSIIHNIFVFTNSRESYYSEAVKCYFIIPPTSTTIALIFNQSGKIFHQANNAHVLVIAFLAMNIYYILLYGIVPIFSLIVNSFTNVHPNWSKEVATIGSQLLLGRIIRLEVRWFLRSIAIYVVVFKLLIIPALMDAKDMAMNITSISSHMFLTMVSFILLKIIHLGCTPIKRTTSVGGNQTRYSKQRRMIAALLFIIFPLIVIGKVIYAFSLLTESGQTKAAAFIEFEKIQWVSRYGSSHTILKVLWMHDLARFSISACIPIYLLLLCVTLS